MEYDWYQVLTSPGMWIIAFITVGNTIVQTVLMFRVSKKTAGKIGLKKEIVGQTIKTAAISAFGPAMSSFIGMVVLVAALGGAVAYIREGAGIGSIMFEFMIAGSGAAAAGVDLTREGMTLIGASTILWGMALCCVPWIITGGIGARSLPKLKDSFLSKEPKMMALVSTTAMMGMFSKLGIDYAYTPILKGNIATPCSFVAGAVTGFLWIKLAEKLKKPALKQYLIIVCIVVGMIVGQLVRSATAQ
ncbi:MAG: DUF5058 family protein [Chloroflexi bacterium]|nr:DUF5058 family protein [Chloroflexota bacterium]